MSPGRGLLLFLDGPATTPVVLRDLGSIGL